MSFGEAVRTCFRKYAVFSGRARRSEFWHFWLFNLLVIILMLAVLGPLILHRTQGVPLAIMGAMVALYMVGTLLPWLGACVRRLHDVGLTGWLMLIICVPYLGGLVLLVLCVLPGTKGDNPYGPDPKIPFAAASSPIH